MLEKPDIQEEKIIACLQEEFGLQVAAIAFLPLGADQNTAVYRAVSGEGSAYFVKLRGGAFDEIIVTLPKYLYDQGIHNIIPPLAARSGQLWIDLAPFKLILYPYIDGRDGYGANLSDDHWRELGAALKRIHTLTLPAALRERIPSETYSPRYRDCLTSFLDGIETKVYVDPVAGQIAASLRARRSVVQDLVQRTARLARELQARTPEFVVCHSDLHAGNVLMATDGALYIVDWDNPILALKERDLMYAGGGQFTNKRTPQEEEILFYQGYGHAPVDQAALTYYRYERIIEDLAIYSEQLLLSGAGGEDREQSLYYMLSNFLTGGTINIAYLMDKTQVR